MVGMVGRTSQLACQRSPHVGLTWATQPLGWYGWPNVGTTYDFNGEMCSRLANVGIWPLTNRRPGVGTWSHINLLHCMSIWFFFHQYIYLINIWPSLLYRKFLPSLFDNIWCCMQFDTSCSFIDIVCAPLLLTSCVEDEERRRNVSVYILCFKEKLCWKKITKVIEGGIRENHF